MKFFIDTADIKEIKELATLNLVDGVTTNPSLIAKTQKNILSILEEICALIPGPVSAEVTADDYETMLEQAKVFTNIAKNICIKLPLTFDGLRACKTLTDAGHQTNLTLCFSPNQALLAAKAGATYISPFIGRLDDICTEGVDVISDIRRIYDNYQFNTQILAASIRSVQHVKLAALLGADIATIPPAVAKTLIHHPLTDNGLKIFAQDWQKTGQNIL